MRLHLRIGINIGDVMIEVKDLFRNGNNVAVRLENLAQPGGVCTKARTSTRWPISTGFGQFMRYSKFVTALGVGISSLMFASIANATTGFHICESPQSGFELTPVGRDADEIELRNNGQKLTIEKFSELTLSESHGFCVARSKYSYTWQIREYLSTVTTRIGGQQRTLKFICTDNNTGVPAGVDHCDDIVTKDNKLVPTYINTVANGREAVLEKDIQTTYATTQNGCSGQPWELVKMESHRISGPQFDCSLQGYKPAGTGLMSVDASCSVDGRATKEPLALDLGNFRDHFELSLPGRDDWISLYPCSPVPGLE